MPEKKSAVRLAAELGMRVLHVLGGRQAIVTKEEFVGALVGAIILLGSLFWVVYEILSILLQ